MKTGKNMKQRPVKGIILTLVLVLLLGCVAGGTVAWLMDTTPAVTNTFTVGNIDIDLKEHDLVNNELDMTREVTEEETYKILPGTTQPKDPFVRVEANSDECWVFIKVEALNDAQDYITYSIDSAVWTPLDEDEDGIADDGVYYKEMPAVPADTELNILTDQTVSYSKDLTKEELDKLYIIEKDSEGNVISMTMKPKEQLPKLQFTAYAIQKKASNDTDFTAALAWQELNPPAAPNP